MNDTFHEVVCNVILQQPQPDRFFMDMRVYDVVPHAMGMPQGQEPALIWRGIYLAVEVKPGSQQGHISRG